MRISKIPILLLVSLFVYACGSSSPGSSPSGDLGGMFSPRIFYQTLEFDDKIWVLGGVDNPSDYSCQGKDSYCRDIWNSEDGKTWELVTSDVAWSPRRLFTATVFKGKIWVLGGNDGTGDQSCEGSTNALCNDVWSSEDGKTWKLVTSNAAWSPRSNSASGVFDNKIWIIGGYDGDYKRDLWSWSGIEGEDWQLVNRDTGFEYSGNFVDFSKRMWTMGRSRRKLGLNQSPEGNNWYDISTPGSTITFGALAVFKDKLWIIGDKQIDSFAMPMEQIGSTAPTVRVITSPSWPDFSHPQSTTSDTKSYSSIIFKDKIWVVEGFVGKDISYNIAWSWSGIAGEDWVRVSY